MNLIDTDVSLEKCTPRGELQRVEVVRDVQIQQLPDKLKTAAECLDVLLASADECLTTLVRENLRLLLNKFQDTFSVEE